ncbi:hypothetical protein ACFO5O_08850 [Geojedonia litorea]|uniref:Nicotinic acid mononucleotide adenyltransferase n=1 Tax=Geojedonia litorea TaxID=1268269 RepID=A0ABV9N4N4_9FLAO
MIKNSLIIFILTFTIIACKESSSETKLDESIEYYLNQPKVVFKKTIHYVDFDSVYYFYDNGLLFKKGKQFEENQKFGIWKLYDKDSDLREIREWFTIYGESQINRVWHLNKKGDTLAWRYQDSIYQQPEFINDTTSIRFTVYGL